MQSGDPANEPNEIGEAGAGETMQILRSQLTLVDQVYEAILSRIEAGAYGADTRLIQEEIAESLGVSRQPVQQALLLLRNEGVLTNAPGRGLMVSPFDQEKARNLYEIRASLDALACGKASERSSTRAAAVGSGYLERGWQAVKSGSISELVAADMAFHHFLYELSGNPMIAETASSHWSYLRCVMGAVLMSGQAPVEIWRHHEAILRAVIDGDVAEAERLARRHINFSASAVLSNADREVQMSH